MVKSLFTINLHFPLLHWEGEHPKPYGSFDTVDGSEILQSPVEVGSLSH